MNSKTYHLSKIDSIEALLKAFPEILKSLETADFGLRASPRSDGDLELRVEALNQKHLFRVQPTLYPSRKVLDDSAPSKSFLLLGPHIPDQLAADYRKQGLNHADLNGRLYLKTPAFLIDREPKALKYGNPTSDPDLFSLKSSRIVRAFLHQRGRDWEQEELASHTKVSPGLVSRILKTLVANGYVSKEPGKSPKSRAAYRLRQFDELLDAWQSKDEWKRRVEITQYSLLSNDLIEIANTVRDSLGEDRAVFTQWFAAHLRHPYTTPPLVSAYVRAREIPPVALARKVSTGGNLWLIAPADEGVFFETQQVGGFHLVSDVQIYLDLLQVGQRGPEQAEALRDWEQFAR